VLSVPRIGRSRAEASIERVVTREQPVGRRDLATPRDTELLAEDICVRLRRPRRDAEAVTDLLVRATRRDQRDYFALSSREFGLFPMKDLMHTATLSPSRPAEYRPKGVFIALLPTA
jgi:hypothetical protein